MALINCKTPLAFCLLILWLSSCATQTVSTSSTINNDGLYSQSESKAAKSSIEHPSTEYINCSEVWVFKRRSSNSDKLGELHLRDSVTVVAKDESGWAKILWQGKEAYISKSFLDTYSHSSASTTNRVYYTGPKGGCYYLTVSGNRVYVDRSLCKGSSTSTSSAPSSRNYSSNPTYTGPKGGTYHYTKSGKKSYYKKK